MRRLLAIVGIAVFAAVFVGGASLAGAQTTPTTIPFTCSYTLSTTTLGTGGGPVQVSGTAPADTDVSISVNGSPAATAHSSPTTGAWGPVTVTIPATPATSTIAVSLLPNYPATPCTGPATVSVAGAQTALPRTGSNDTQPLVLIGVAVLVVGAALALAARRREHTRGRI